MANDIHLLRDHVRSLISIPPNATGVRIGQVGEDIKKSVYALREFDSDLSLCYLAFRSVGQVV